MKNKFKRRTKGFTLVEMAIVLVIIGLVVSSVMIGSSMIRSAAVRSTIAQIDQIRSATSTFLLKFNSLPGDILYSQAAAFGLSYIPNTKPVNGKGDGNGIIVGYDTPYSGTWGTIQGGETLLFWLHLKETGLINGGFAGIVNLDNSAITGPVTANVKLGSGELYRQAYLTSKLADNAYYIIYSDTLGVNYLTLTGITSMDANFRIPVVDANLMPYEVYQIDVKIDDGIPNSGNMLAAGPATPSWISATVNETYIPGCVSSSTKYAVDSTTPSCAFRIKLQGG